MIKDEVGGGGCSVWLNEYRRVWTVGKLRRLENKCDKREGLSGGRGGNERGSGVWSPLDEYEVPGRSTVEELGTGPTLISSLRKEGVMTSDYYYAYLYLTGVHYSWQEPWNTCNIVNLKLSLGYTIMRMIHYLSVSNTLNGFLRINQLPFRSWVLVLSFRYEKGWNLWKRVMSHRSWILKRDGHIPWYRPMETQSFGKLRRWQKLILNIGIIGFITDIYHPQIIYTPFSPWVTDLYSSPRSKKKILI